MFIMKKTSQLLVESNIMTNSTALSLDKLHSLSSVEGSFRWGVDPVAPEVPRAAQRAKTYGVDADGVSRTGSYVKIPEDSWESRFYSHIVSAGLALANRMTAYAAREFNNDNTVRFTPLFAPPSQDRLDQALMVYAKTTSGHHIYTGAETLPKLHHRITLEQFERDVHNASAAVLGFWRADEYMTATAARAAASRGGLRSRRDKDVTTHMVAPFLEALEGYSKPQAARILADMPWTTPTGRELAYVSEKTMQRRLTELGFKGTGERRKKAKVSWHALDGLDGLTVAQQAAELGLSPRKVSQLRAERKAGLEGYSERSTPETPVPVNMDVPEQVETLVFDFYTYMEQFRMEREAKAVEEMSALLDDWLP